MYKLAFENLLKISTFEHDWDGEGSPSFSKDIVKAAFDYLNKVKSEGKISPSDVYACCLEIVIEWQYKDTDIIERVSFTEWNHDIVSQKMTSYPDKPPVFELLNITV